MKGKTQSKKKLRLTNKASRKKPIIKKTKNTLSQNITETSTSSKSNYTTKSILRRKRSRLWEFKQDDAGNEWLYPCVLTKHPDIKFQSPELQPPPRYGYEDTKVSEFIRKRMKKLPYHAYILEEDLDDETIRELEECKEAFNEKEADATYALEAFIIAHKAGLYPPMWVMNYVAEIFNDWYLQQGKKSLDELFELINPRGNTTTTVSENLMRQRDDNICRDIWRLHEDHDYSLERAFNIVAEWAKNLGIYDIPEHELEAPDKAGIKTMFHRKYHKPLTEDRIYSRYMLKYSEKEDGDFNKRLLEYERVNSRKEKKKKTSLKRNEDF